MIGKQFLAEQLAALDQQEQAQRQTIATAQSALERIEGARQMCRFLNARLDEAVAEMEKVNAAAEAASLEAADAPVID